MRVDEIITQKIINELEKGRIPWKKPWIGEYPSNLVSGKEYQGVNFFLLSSLDYERPYFLTFKQASDLGGAVKKGEHGYPVVYWDVLEETKKEGKEEEEDEVVKIPFLKYYTVFNVAQCEGIKVPKLKGKRRILSKEKIVSCYENRPKIISGGSRACYSVKTDEIRIPILNLFKDSESYYVTLYHELIHSTGHSKRLNRFADNVDSGIFGSESYSKEELIAELGAAFLCARTKIDNRQVKQSAGYIQSWLKALKNDSRFVIHAASKAQKAVDFVTGQKNHHR